MGEVTRCFRISDRVQGVHFRHGTRIEAQRLGIRGVARNLADGSVEVIARGVVELDSTVHAGALREERAHPSFSVE